MATFGERLRFLRQEKKITQKELARQFKLAESAISMYERNERTPSRDLTKEMADYFEVFTDYLLGHSDFRTAKEAAEKWDTESSGTRSAEQNIGRAFFGGADQYTEDELEIARAAAQAAVEAYRKGLNKKK